MKGNKTMKKWTTPTIEELQLKYTSTIPVVADETSGEDDFQDDNWQCDNPNWDGKDAPTEIKGWVDTGSTH